jgi:7-cyano-7-deazaguanine synthase in queuosine biosynthesis
MITLESFKVLKSLKVKDIRIEPRKVSASYCVEKFTGEISSYDFAYSYEKPYFDKNDPEDINLASMMLAQVAINYGLFFETIEFEGLFDKSDRQFIRDMTENTSREILTNKLLIRNEFLKSPFDSLEPEKRDKYTQAELVFSNSRFAELTVPVKKATTDKGKYAILSSGGKDSLLTYGIIKEIGEAYPIFINEAGRHWFTAVNAYRYYKETEANTEKPWCNSDRLFNWMVRQMPFIKENYASIRADIYPIRLWTVAVFLFGVLPIARKHGIGNILIGDEYDTTQKGNMNGISHYNGLYDQSHYFDNALTRYYTRKGWNIYQYSILRSLSEMLIMKTLIKRYPDLQRHQVSCHAAHKSGEKMYPCGKCEKCRRIIGMIKALDEDPAVCGYNEEQIAYGLSALAGRSVKQIGSDAAQLYYSLVEKDLIEKNPFTKKAAHRHPEIMALRFDRERSRLEDLPRHIRVPLFAILREYADGILKRVDGKWLPMDLNNDMLNETEYKFDEK